MKFILFFCLCSSFIFAETIEEKHIVLSGFIFFATVSVFIIYKIVHIAYSNFKFNSHQPKKEIDMDEDFENPYENESLNENEESTDLNQCFDSFIQEKLNKEKSIPKNFDSDNDSEFKEKENPNH